MKGSGHLKTAVVAALVGAIAATGTVALAGTGIGGVFNLGQTNTVNGHSLLVGNTADTHFQVRNDNTGATAGAIAGVGKSSFPAVRGINLANGPAASFVTSLPGVPPFLVSAGSGKVVNLNADELDGVDSAGFLKPSSVAAGDVTGPYTNLQLGPDSVGSAEIATDAVKATEIANDSIDSGEIVDFGLSNQDVGVLFAQVNADGTISNSSGGVTGTHISAGTYAVDFGRTISSCAFVMTQGEAGVGGAGGAITGATDRSGNAEAVFATTRTNANVLVDRAFQLVVVC